MKCLTIIILENTLLYSLKHIVKRKIFITYASLIHNDNAIVTMNMRMELIHAKIPIYTNDIYFIKTLIVRLAGSLPH